MLIEIAVKVYLVADLVLSSVHPSIRYMLAHFFLKVFFNVILQGHVLISRAALGPVSYLPPAPLKATGSASGSFCVNTLRKIFFSAAFQLDWRA